jgi:hypothetical protein
MRFVLGLIKRYLTIAVLISSSDDKAQDFTCLTHELRHAFDEQALKVDAVKLNQALWTKLCFLQTFEACRYCVASFRMAECRHVCVAVTCSE